MREFKFRAWNKKRNEMRYWDFEKDGTGIGVFFNSDLMIPMQFTGLRDRNGREIYEGDCMFAEGNLYGEEFIGIVEWDADDARFEVVGLHGRFEYIPHECYVKGNIFENPNLLQQK